MSDPFDCPKATQRRLDLIADMEARELPEEERVARLADFDALAERLANPPGPTVPE